MRPPASARTTGQPLGGVTIDGPVGGAGESPTSSPIAENGVPTLGMLLLTFGLVSGLVLLVFGRRQPSRGAQLATVRAVVAQPAPPATPPARRPSYPVDDEEAGLPRWLRPSVRAERFWTPEREAADRRLRARRVVELTEAPADAIRMVVRYDDANLYDGPNESYAAIVDRLHTGDEVLVTRTDADWAEVRTPKGATGWLPSMTLVAMAGASPPATPAEGPSEPAADRPAKRSRSRAATNRPAAPS